VPPPRGCSPARFKARPMYTPAVRVEGEEGVMGKSMSSRDAVERRRDRALKLSSKGEEFPPLPSKASPDFAPPPAPAPPEEEEEEEREADASPLEVSPAAIKAALSLPRMVGPKCSESAARSAERRAEREAAVEGRGAKEEDRVTIKRDRCTTLCKAGMEPLRMEEVVAVVALVPRYEAATAPVDHVEVSVTPPAPPPPPNSVSLRPLGSHAPGQAPPSPRTSPTLLSRAASTRVWRARRGAGGEEATTPSAFPTAMPLAAVEA
jgi:hypothetical protein